MSPQNATTWPNIHATMNPDGSARLTTNGFNRDFPPADPDETRQAIMGAVTETAQEFNRKVRLRTEGTMGEWVMIVDPSGSIETETVPSVNRRASVEPPTQAPPISPIDHRPISRLRSSSVETPPSPHGINRVLPATPVTNAPTDAVPLPPAVPRRRAEVGTLLTSRPAQEPAQTGWRGLLSRAGIRMKPSPVELARREDVRAVSQHWSGLRTIAIANPKGGANKTPTTLMLAAMFARMGGSGVVAWDNNETRGTLGWRSEQGPHASTVLDLLPHVGELLDPAARAGDMARFLHHQPADRYDVLRSDDAVESDHEIVALEVNEIHAVLGKYYRCVFIDTGNSERANNWRAALGRADHL